MVEGKFYIGGSLVLQERLKSHFFTDYPDIELQKGSNKPLQRAIKRHGMDKFQVIIFHEFSHVSHIDILMFLLGEYEQWFLSNVNQRRLYNIRLKSNFLGPISNLEPDHSIHQLKPDNTIKMPVRNNTIKMPVRKANKAYNRIITPIPVKVVDLKSPYFQDYYYYSSIYSAYRSFGLTKYAFSKMRGEGSPFVINNRWLVIVG